MGFSGWIKPPPYNRAVGMHALLAQHSRCYQTPLSINFWSDRVRHSELALPCVRRSGAVGMGFPGWIKPPPYNRAVGMHALLVQHSRCYQTPLSTNFWSDRVRRSELALPSVRRSGAWRFLSSRPTKVLLNNHFVHMHFFIFF